MRVPFYSSTLSLSLQLCNAYACALLCCTRLMNTFIVSGNNDENSSGFLFFSWKKKTWQLKSQWKSTSLKFCACMSIQRTNWYWYRCLDAPLKNVVSSLRQIRERQKNHCKRHIFRWKCILTFIGHLKFHQQTFVLF